MTPAVALSSERIEAESFIKRPAPLARHGRPIAENLKDAEQVTRHDIPSVRPNNGNGDASVYRHESCGTISERAKRALERRLRPHTTLSAYELAYTLRISESTIWAILSGNSKSGPSGRVLFKLVEFFGATLLQEIFGGPNVYCIDPRDAKKAAHIKRIQELQAELEAMG